MKVMAKFFYDSKNFPKIEYPGIVGQVVDTRFNNFVTSLFSKEEDYWTLNSSRFERENRSSLEIIGFGKSPDKVQLKNLFSLIFSNEESLLPYMVSCNDKEDYFLVEEVLSEEKSCKKLSSGAYEFFFNKRFFE